jgi:hypothetical protein
MTLDELIARWNTDEGKPYKGRLIDMEAYTSGQDNPGCMCAQGQVLHDLGGWMPEQLKNVTQTNADIATATLLNISRSHSILLRQVNDSVDGAPGIVLTDPGKILGDQWSKVLDFWAHLDCMTKDQWDAAWDAARAVPCDVAWDARWDATEAVAGTVAGAVARRATWDATGAVPWDVAWDARWDATEAVAGATNEIQGAEILKRDGKPLFFLPMFGFAAPDDIPPRPENYGVPS